MIKTITPIGSQGEVLAPIGAPGVFYRGKRVKIMVKKPGKDKDTPLAVREALVGLEVSTIFTVEQILEQAGTDLNLPAGARLAYAQEVVETLISAGKKEVAEELKKAAGGDLDMYVFELGVFTVVD